MIFKTVNLFNKTFKYNRTYFQTEHIYPDIFLKKENLLKVRINKFNKLIYIFTADGHSDGGTRRSICPFTKAARITTDGI